MSQSLGTTLHAIDLMLLGRLVLLSLVSVVIPVFTLQHAIVVLGAPRVSIIVPSVPALALLVEQSFVGWPSPLVPSLIVATCVAVLFSNAWMSMRPTNHALSSAKP
ncbi:hypothetical protein [Verminephrobacter aporrectodeae]|uniref:hypothetical protein n=1 Tax=Verminephrobacter aporrectodeae TaxID=1110389 RepID=UPI0022380129|nr:hypothetical protein [Verminephrobacter aporrectodeae]